MEIVRRDLNELLSFDEAQIEQITQEAVRQANALLGIENKEQALEEQRRKLLSNTSEERKIRDAYGLFFGMAKRYSHIETLDRKILHTFVERIEIGEKSRPGA